MTRRVHLGEFQSGRAFNADLDIVLRSNVLVQANSGGGKSWLLRRFIEQAFGRVPQIIIDPEGEFSTLRKEFDFVLVGKGGDTPADIRSAQLLAHRLLKLGASAIVDLFEMSKTQRPLWVATFVQALVDAPKKLWRDLLLYVDEAHELAPELGHGVNESRDEKTCRHALIDMAAKGRKRGYGVVAATQRLGKLSKDFAAELKNVLIGQTFIDIDRDRAAGNLGIAKADKVQFFRDVKNVPPGRFYALGRAFVLEPTLVTIGTVQTKHPEAGRRQSAAPPPTDKIKHLLPQLSDLPKEAEQKLQTEKELRARIAELERTQGAVAKIAAPVTVPGKTVEKSVLKEADHKRLEKAISKLADVESKFSTDVAGVMKRAVDTLSQRQQVVVSELGNISTALKRANHPTALPTAHAPPVPSPEPNWNTMLTGLAGKRPVARRLDAPSTNGTTEITKYARELLNVVAARGRASDSQISALSGYRITSSGFGKAIAQLVAAGLIEGIPSDRRLTDAGRAEAGVVQALPTGRALFDHWMQRLTTYEAAVLRAVHEHGTVSRDRLSEETGYRQTSSGFGKAIGALKKLDLIRGTDGGDLTIADSFQ